MIVLVTGVMASGKSTVAQALAEQLPKSVHLRGDTFRRMIVSGRADMSANPSAEALHQLQLRYALAVAAARQFHDAGFDVVYQDVILGQVLADVVAQFGDLPLSVVVLTPNADVVQERETARPKVGYHAISVAQLQAGLAATPRLGWWLDNSGLTVEETVAAILARCFSEEPRPGRTSIAAVQLAARNSRPK